MAPAPLVLFRETTCWAVAGVVRNHGWLMALVVEGLITPAVNGIDEPPVISADPTTAETSVAG